MYRPSAIGTSLDTTSYHTHLLSLSNLLLTPVWFDQAGPIYRYYHQCFTLCGRKDFSTRHAGPPIGVPSRFPCERALRGVKPSPDAREKACGISSRSRCSRNHLNDFSLLLWPELRTTANTDRRDSASACLALRGLRTWHVGTLFAREPGELLLGLFRSRRAVRIGKTRSRSR